MTLVVLPAAMAAVGVCSLCVAVYHERRMHRHRRPGVSYAKATFRRDGGWRRSELFTHVGLDYQHKASRYGVMGALLLIGALILWVVIGSPS